MKSGRIAYLLTAFPTVSETFVEGEFRALMARGFPIDLYATRNFREPIDPGDSQSDRGLDIQRAPYLLSREVVASCLGFLLRRPLRTLGAFASVTIGNLPSPRYLLHALALFPKSLAFARRMERRGTVHVHATWGHYPATSAFVISRILGIPFSFSAHAGLDVSSDTTFQSTKIRAARFVLTCNEASRRFLEARNPEDSSRIHSVYHGVLLAEVPPPGSLPKAAPPEIVSVGRLAPEKGFCDLLEACDLLRRRGAPFRLRVFGEGPHRRRLEDAIERRGLGGSVVLEGAAPHASVLEACARATIVALASYRGPRGFLDGISNVLVEAMACGTPVVSTDYEGSRELLQAGKVGILVPQRDPRELADALERLLRDSALRAELSRCGRRRVEQSFDRETNVEAIASLLSSVLEEPSSRGVGATVSARASG